MPTKPFIEELTTARNTIQAWDVDQALGEQSITIGAYTVQCRSRRPNSGYGWMVTHESAGLLQRGRLADTMHQARHDALDFVEMHAHQMATA